MTSSTKIALKEQFGQDLLLRSLAIKLFTDINTLLSAEVIIDFKDITTISRSFAQEYQSKKKEATKRIKEMNLNPDVKAMFSVIQKEVKKTIFFESDPEKVINV